jgi:hypothetical protein
MVTTARHSAPGRNDPCPCGSGRKYKQCCEKKQRAMSPTRRLLLFGGLAALAIVVAMAISSAMNRPDTAGRVWSAEHGHWHDR